MFREIVRSSMVVLALGLAACDDVPTTPTAPDGETEFDPSFDLSLPPDGGTCPDVFYEQSRLLSNGTTLTWTSVLAGFEYSEGADYLADVNWSVDQGTVTFVGFTTRNGPNTWTPRRDVDGLMTPGAAGEGTLPVTVSMIPMHEAGETSDDDDDEDDGDWAGKIGNGHFWLRLEIEGADGKVKRVKLGVNFHLEDPADGFGNNCPGDDPPAGNEPPIADAGPNQTVTDSDGGGENVALDGSGSVDPDGSIVSYRWTEGGGEIATGVNPTVLFAVGPHEVTLTVTDDAGATDTDVVVITVDEPGANEPPIADAGPNQTVTDSDGGGENVALDGSGSTDPDGSIVSYLWTEGGSEIATGVNPTVLFAVGPHEVTLTVTDDAGATDTDVVVITVDEPGANEPPIADAGPNQTVTDSDGGGENVALDGSGSVDPDGSIVSYRWTEGGGEIATGVNPTVLFAVGPHEVTLTVTDDAGATDTDVVVITVEEPPAPGVSYAADIQPYFNSNCTGCHGSGGAPGGVHLNSWTNVRAGADDGTPLVVPGNSSDGSAILLPQMQDGHQGAPHGTNIIQQIADWIDAGALNN